MVSSHRVVLRLVGDTSTGTTHTHHHHEGQGMETYKIVRKYQAEDQADEEVETGLTLEEAQAHCDDSESSSRTCTSEEGVQRTQEKGAWFDAYYDE